MAACRRARICARPLLPSAFGLLHTVVSLVGSIVAAAGAVADAAQKQPLTEFIRETCLQPRGRGEPRAVAFLKAANHTELKSLPFPDIETLVSLGWWDAAEAAVVKAHQFKMDFTAPVRRATAEVKREADALLRWLDPRWALPQTTPMAVHWTQNATTVGFAARFAPKWHALGATLSVFSSQHGQGHIDNKATAGLVESLLDINITRNAVHAEIVAEAGSARKRYTLDVDLFDEVVPGCSSWEVSFYRAQGSMQMSTGAKIPQLNVYLCKRWPSQSPWPRPSVTAGSGDEGPSTSGPTAAWTEDLMIVMDSIPAAASAESSPLQVTALTCGLQGLAFCASKGSCLTPSETSCAQGCPGLQFLGASVPRCFALPEAREELVEATFEDTDPRHGMLGGAIRLPIAASQGGLEDRLVLRLGDDLSQPPLAQVPFCAWSKRQTETGTIEFVLPAEGVPMPTTTKLRLKVFGANDAGEVLVAEVKTVDRAKPAPVQVFAGPDGAEFVDLDSRTSWIGGTLKVRPAPENMAPIASVGVWWGRLGSDGNVDKLSFDVEHNLLSGHRRQGDYIFLDVRGSDMPHEATHLVVDAESTTGWTSDPVAVKVVDVSPPTISAKSFLVSDDAVRKRGWVSVNVSLRHAPSCPLSKLPGEPSCTISSYALYWGDSRSRKLGEPFAVLPVVENASHDATASPPAPRAPKVEAATTRPRPRPRQKPGSTIRHELGPVKVPEGARTILALARNTHGEANAWDAAVTSFLDDATEERTEAIVVQQATDSVMVWRPWLAADEIRNVPLEAHVGSRIMALAISEDGDRVAISWRADTSKPTVLYIDVETGKPLVNSFGSQRTHSLALSGRHRRGANGQVKPPMLLRGVFGAIELWDLGGADAKQKAAFPLGNESTAVDAVQVDWDLFRAAAMLEGGAVMIVDLAAPADTAVMAELRPKSSEQLSSTSDCAVDFVELECWRGYSDESIQLLNVHASDTEPGLRGHTEVTRHVFLDTVTGRKQVLTATKDGTIALWDHKTREVIEQFSLAKRKRVSILAMHVDWREMQAVIVCDDGTLQVLDLNQEQNYAVGERVGVREKNPRDWKFGAVAEHWTGEKDRPLAVKFSSGIKRAAWKEVVREVVSKSAATSGGAWKAAAIQVGTPR
eukprot:TRINITY_DN50073_c0_g1_i1.p1 TRINITY_DN50073_c0_g1~~TRINITY_DN50073_c0_g1_i1.p1  ORF type:complete len:1152 (-),score=202.48 TRINITY_DN50073_c0_g1_i1:20-3448(-)